MSIRIVGVLLALYPHYPVLAASTVNRTCGVMQIVCIVRLITLEEVFDPKGTGNCAAGLGTAVLAFALAAPLAIQFR